MKLRLLIAFLLVTALAFCAGAFAAVSVNLSEAILFSDSGEVIIPGGEWQRTATLGDTGLIAAVDAKGGIYVLNANGIVLSDSVYSDAEGRGNRLILCENGKYGVTDLRLNTVIPFEYTFIAFGDKGQYLALKGDLWDDIADAVYMVTEDGTSDVTGIRLMYPVYALNDLSSACLSGKNGRWGYMNPDGTWRIEAMFLSGGKVIDGMAAVTFATGTGVLNMNGDWLISPFCDSVQMTDTVIVTVKNGTVDVYSRDSEGCRKVYSVKGTGASAAGIYACVNTETVQIVYNIRNGIMFSCDNSIAFSAGYGDRLIKISGSEAALTDGRGRELGSRWAHIEPLCEGFYAAYADSDTGFEVCITDSSGETACETAFNKVTSPAAGYIAAEDDEGVYLFEASGGELKTIGRYLSDR